VLPSSIKPNTADTNPQGLTATVVVSETLDWILLVMVMIDAGRIVEWRSACLVIMDEVMYHVNIETIALYFHHLVVETGGMISHQVHPQDRVADVTILLHHLVLLGKCSSQLRDHDPLGIKPKIPIMEDSINLRSQGHH
jgi:hypothetical protein